MTHLFSHPGGFAVGSHFGLSLHFPDHKYGSALFLMLVGHLGYFFL